MARQMSKPFDLLSLLTNFAREHAVSLDDPALLPCFVEHVRSQSVEALQDKALLHGYRAEGLFEALVRSLNRYSLFKAEDTGKAYASGRVRPPDFRVKFLDGEQRLVEVKNVYVENPRRQRKSLSTEYMNSLRAYAELVGCPLLLAVYWARWGIWTVACLSV